MSQIDLTDEQLEKWLLMEECGSPVSRSALSCEQSVAALRSLQQARRERDEARDYHETWKARAERAEREDAAAVQQIRASLDLANLEVDRLRAERDGLAAQVGEMRAVVDRYRKYVHGISQHNQWFERCESSWCNPSQSLDASDNNDPAGLYAALSRRAPAELERIKLEAAAEELERLVADGCTTVFGGDLPHVTASALLARARELRAQANSPVIPDGSEVER